MALTKQITMFGYTEGIYMRRDLIHMTFEKVLEVFSDYLLEDTICQVVTTPQGYTVLYWDQRQEDWFLVVYCRTPEMMRDVFLDGYSNFLEYNITKARRDLASEEMDYIESRCAERYNLCEQ